MRAGECAHVDMHGAIVEQRDRVLVCGGDVAAARAAPPPAGDALDLCPVRRVPEDQVCRLRDATLQSDSNTEDLAVNATRVRVRDSCKHSRQAVAKKRSASQYTTKWVLLPLAGPACVHDSVPPALSKQSFVWST